MENTQNTLRKTARQLVADEAHAACVKSHERNYEKLYVRRDGTVEWSQFSDRTSDLIDNEADTFRPVLSVVTVGTGSMDCDCDHCASGGAAAEALGDDDASLMEVELLDQFGRIELGYFHDEAAE